MLDLDWWWMFKAGIAVSLVCAWGFMGWVVWIGLWMLGSWLMSPSTRVQPRQDAAEEPIPLSRVRRRSLTPRPNGNDWLWKDVEP